MTTTYEIGVTTGDTFTPIATLSFDRANTGTLVLGAPHPRTPHLVQVWDLLADRDVIRIKKSERVKTEDGSRKFAYVGYDVDRSDPEYPEAILRFMAHEYAFDSRAVP